jgi:putative transferase (TIGR04331 family)
LNTSQQDWFVTTERVFNEVSHQIAQNLNEVHETGHTTRYWTVFLGAWLQQFVDMALLRVFEIHHHSSVPTPTLQFAPAASLREFQEQTKMPAFIEQLHHDVQNEYGKDSIHLESGFNPPPHDATPAKLKGTFISASYLPRFSDFLLRARFGLPPTGVNTISVPESEVDYTMRSRVTNTNHGLSSESRLIISLLEHYLPRAYLESYSKLIHTAKPWRSRAFPKVIFTSNRHLYDDVFNYWVAEATERGTKLVLGQHGGNYGISEFPSYSERHEALVSDRYITWGWSQSAKYVPGLILISAKQRLSIPPERARLTVVTDQLWTYPRSIFSDLSTHSTYRNYLASVINGLDDSVKAQALLRLHHGDDATSAPQSSWWKAQCPNIALDDGAKSFRQRLQESRLLVIAHNGTSLPEAIALGFPTLVTWSDSYMKVRPEAEPVFQLMERAGMFHSTPESAAAFINRIWDDVDGWWNSPQVIDARSQFCNQYARTVPHPVRFLAKALKF